MHLKYISVFFLIIILISCKKDSDGTETNNSINTIDSTQYLKFKANGKTYEFTNRSEIKIEVIDAPSTYKKVWELTAWNTITDNKLAIPFYSTTGTTLTAGTYNVTYDFLMQGTSIGAGATLDNVKYITKNGNVANINITKFENNKATGTFSVTMVFESGNTPITLSEGVFRNINVLQ